ncbi:MAG: AAA family ATPase [Acidimicrobiales bacterium]|nr:AAA family ATPase [Acidimicrobiales bacterium]
MAVEIADLEQFELDARKAKIEQILQRQQEDPARMAAIADTDAKRVTRAAEALTALEQLRIDHDGEAFVVFMEAWCRLPGYDAFRGLSGQMFLKQVLKAGEPGEAVALLAQCLTAPADDADAKKKIDLLVAFVEKVKSGGQPAPARVPFLLSFFWGLQDPQEWPVMWTSARDTLRDLGWLVEASSHASLYLQFASTVRSVGDPPAVAHGLYWFSKRPFVGLAPGLVQRCSIGAKLAELATDAGYPSQTIEAAAEANAWALTNDVWLAVSALQEQVSAALGRPVQIRAGSRKSGDVLHRWWATSQWQPKGQRASIRLAVTVDGTYVGLYPGFVDSAWDATARAIVKDHRPEGLEFFRPWVDDDQGRYLLTGTEPSPGGFILGRFYPGVEALDSPELADEIITVVSSLQPVMDLLATAAIVEPQPSDGEDSPPHPQGDLANLVAEFRAATGYPTDKDDKAHIDREVLAKLLVPDNLEISDPTSLKPFINTGRYGSPGPQAVLNATLTSLDGAEQERFMALISMVLWGAEPVEDRINQALDPKDGFKGLGESVLMKLLAVAHPDQFLPVFPFTGEMGKATLMQLIGLTPPPATATRGAKQVQANDSIRQALDPHLPGDPWAQARFLYWLKGRPPGGAHPDALDPIPGLASELFLSEDFFRDVLDLLEDKGQVIFFGPPGTGKTYVAQRIAEAITNDPSQRMLVQFHPSTSYEDFFEGYRPEPGPDGQLTYKLIPGPLARLAAAAEATSPDVKHVMVIDEINRANLPKVLGELLFLLEYRDAPIQTLYRPDEPFTLPPNLFIIGTMNTADRSVALIDAAMRRRFHFIPFFPHDEPHDTVLSKWLAKNNSEMSWVASFIEHVNTRLTKLLGGPHLQIGPSHFFKKNLDMDELKKIWTYSIMPYIEDQLWGQPDQLKSFVFEAAYGEYTKEGGGPIDREPEASPDVTVNPPGEAVNQAKADAGDVEDG